MLLTSVPDIATPRNMSIFGLLWLLDHGGVGDSIVRRSAPPLARKPSMIVPAICDGKPLGIATPTRSTTAGVQETTSAIIAPMTTFRLSKSPVRAGSASDSTELREKPRFPLIARSDYIVQGLAWMSVSSPLRSPAIGSSFAGIFPGAHLLLQGMTNVWQDWGMEFHIPSEQ